MQIFFHFSLKYARALAYVKNNVYLCSKFDLYEDSIEISIVVRANQAEELEGTPPFAAVVLGIDAAVQCALSALR